MCSLATVLLGFCQDCSLVLKVHRSQGYCSKRAQKVAQTVICRLVLSCVQRNNLSKDGALFKPHDVTQSNFRWDLPAGQVQYFYE